MLLLLFLIVLLLYVFFYNMILVFIACYKADFKSGCGVIYFGSKDGPSVAFSASWGLADPVPPVSVSNPQ